MSRWTAGDIPDLAGQVAVVTGANSGIGYETALQLALHGARVLATARSPERGEDALRRLRRAAPDAHVTLVLADLADLDSIERAAAVIAEATAGIDVLVNNAGVMAVPRRLTTAQGFELQLGTNHLGHFALTGRLLPLLLERATARVVTVSSVAHRRARLDLEDLESVTSYAPWQAYGRSKLSNVLFFLELDRRARAAHRALVSVGAHPGLTATNLASSGPRLAPLDGGAPKRSIENVLLAAGTQALGQSQARGALPSLFAATAPEVQGGQYFGPSGPGELRGAPRLRTVSSTGQDADVARRLWELSEGLTGVRFVGLSSPGSDGKTPNGAG